MIKAIIVEDQPKHYKYLQELLHKTTKQVEVLAVATNVPDAYNAIVKLKPGLLFLDIELDDNGRGFDLLKKFEKPDFAVIFTTSYNNSDNAIAALRACALDFLPKPLDISELNDALNRIDSDSSVQQTQTLAENINSDDEKIQAVWIASTEGKTKIETGNILYCESDSVYTTFYLLEAINKKQAFTSSTGLKEWERNLANSDIFRVHNEFMVNKAHVVKYNTKISGSAELTLSDGKKIPVSKSRKDEVKERLKLRK